MKMQVCAVFDSAVKIFESPFFMRSRGEALRSWESVVNDDKTKFCMHPNDFSLFVVAEYDDQTGKFENLVPPVSLGLAAQFKKAPSSPAPLFDRILDDGKEKFVQSPVSAVKQ